MGLQKVNERMSGPGSVIQVVGKTITRNDFSDSWTYAGDATVPLIWKFIGPAGDETGPDGFWVELSPKGEDSNFVISFTIHIGGSANFEGFSKLVRQYSSSGPATGSGLVDFVGDSGNNFTPTTTYARYDGQTSYPVGRSVQLFDNSFTGSGGTLRYSIQWTSFYNYTQYLNRAGDSGNNRERGATVSSIIVQEIMS